jgi:hypothetical protein
MTARTMGTLLVGAMLSVGAARAQAPGTPGGGSTGSSGTGTSGTGTATGGAPGTSGGVTFDPAAAAAARLFGNYRVPGAAPLDTSGVYRVDTGSSAPPAGGGGSSAGSTGSTTTTATTNTSTSGTATAGGTGSP